MFREIDVYFICCDAEPRSKETDLAMACKRIIKTLSRQKTISAVKNVLTSDNETAKCIANVISKCLKIPYTVNNLLHERVIYNDCSIETNSYSKCNERTNHESGLEFRNRIDAFKATINNDIIVVSHSSLFRYLTGGDKILNDEVAILTYEAYNPQYNDRY